MTLYRYRAATTAGVLRTGALDAASPADALDQLRRLGLRPIEAAPASPGRRTAEGGPRPPPLALARALGELAVMLDAGVALDRALAVAADTAEDARVRAAFARLLERVREGAPLSRAMAEDKGAGFPPVAAAMAAAGEANGRSADALSRLAETLERAEALKSTIVSALVYPALLLVIATGVVALMLLWVVPQFEGLFADAPGQLPPITVAVLAASRAARAYGLWAVLALTLGAVAVWRWTRRPQARLALDRLVLSLPQVGAVVRRAETARFARVLSSLVGGGVALPEALAIACGSLANTDMRAAVAKVAEGLRRGGGLTQPLAASGALPAVALSYLRTGEETARLGPMLGRLADMLDRDVRVRIERMIAVLTPVVTVAMGAIVATVIASIMSAIIGFDDLALGK